ncbi:hypothetical protein [Lysinibacter sp. HNR]|uniref:RCC1 domain-containing protein n=1 Tax=Lysinibacter sp. HNR TaxID=3031408 RepID=UPI0024355F91|nr:hypothetical protein [Lysinibacter sp. HNR]WGD38144.1 hypothetical protein FrondiHNR_04305 [Lysinibacter sp. HNR]
MHHFRRALTQSTAAFTLIGLVFAGMATPALATNTAEPGATVTTSPDPTADTLLGSGPTAGNTLVDIPVDDAIDRVVQITPGVFHTVALTESGQLWSWGRNANGQLGDGTSTSRHNLTPVDMSGALANERVTQLSTRRDQSMVITESGKLFGWGLNSDGRLGDGSTTLRRSPVAVDMSGALAGERVTQVSMGQSNTLALTESGKLFAWGDSTTGSNGNGRTSPTRQTTPVPVTMTGALAGEQVTQIAMGTGNALVLTESGKLFSWGSGTSGELGNGAFSNASTPVPVSMTGALAGEQVIQIDTYQGSVAVLTESGKLVTWGAGTLGQLGNGTTANSSVPVAVDLTGELAGEHVTQLSVGFSVTAVITESQKLFTWGSGTDGRLGNGTLQPALTPTAVIMTGALKKEKPLRVMAGQGGRVITESGKLFSWGQGLYGQLGNETTENAVEPVAAHPTGIDGLRGVWFGENYVPGAQIEDGIASVLSPPHRSGVVQVEWETASRGRIGVGTFQYGTAPTVTAHPQNLTVGATGTAVLNAAASGDETPTVQWQASTDGGVEWTDVVDATTPTLTILSADLVNNTQYRAVFSNELGQVITDAALLTVQAIPAVTGGAVTIPVSGSTLFALGVETAGSIVSSVVTAEPSVGTVTVDESGITYTAESTSGVFTFEVTHTDNLGQRATAVFTVTVQQASLKNASFSVSSGEETVGSGSHTVTVTLRDQFDSPFSGQAANLTAAAASGALGAGNISNFTETTNSGTYTATVTSTRIGPKAITAAFGREELTADGNSSALFIAGEVSIPSADTSYTVSVGPQLTDSGKHIVTVKLADSFGNGVPGRAADLRALASDSLGSGHITNFTETSVTGSYTATVQSSSAGEKGITILHSNSPLSLDENGNSVALFVVPLILETTTMAAVVPEHGSHTFVPEVVSGIVVEAHVTTPPVVGSATIDPTTFDVTFNAGSANAGTYEFTVLLRSTPSAAASTAPLNEDVPGLEVLVVHTVTIQAAPTGSGKRIELGPKQTSVVLAPLAEVTGTNVRPLTPDSIVSLPTSGKITRWAEDSVEYAVTPGFTGEERFTIRVSDDLNQYVDLEYIIDVPQIATDKDRSLATTGSNGSLLGLLAAGSLLAAATVVLVRHRRAKMQ